MLCPICHDEPATVTVQLGPVFTKVGAQCMGSGLHLIRLLSRLV